MATAPFPEALVPMLARLAQLPADDAGWGVEVKWDGVRAIAHCRAGELELRTRNLNLVSGRYPEIAPLAGLLGRDAVLDGELVAFDDAGRPSFGRLQQRMHLGSAAAVRQRLAAYPVTYVIFDLLHLDGADLMGEPYERRRELLEGLELEGVSWQTPGYSRGHAAELLAASAAHELEGIVLKRLDSRYVPGGRTGAWLKVKNTSRQELVVAGWTPGEGRRRDHLGALLVGFYEDADGGAALRYAGKVGTGFKQRDLAELVRRLRPLERETSPFEAGPEPPKDANFAEPELVAEIEFRETTAEGLLRHAAYKGLREDKPASAVRLERPEA